MDEGPNDSPAPSGRKGVGGECGPAARGAPPLGAYPISAHPPIPRFPPTANPTEPPAAGGARAKTVKPAPRSKQREAPGDRGRTTGSPPVPPQEGRGTRGGAPLGPYAMRPHTATRPLPR